MDFNRRDAERFLSLFADDCFVTFQVFDDSKRTNHAEHFTGDLEAFGDKLEALNARKCGIYFMVNEGTGLGRSESEVRAVRALFLDLDGAPLVPVMAAKIEPHAIIESSPGRYQVFYLVKDCPLDRFRGLQKRLAHRFNGDTSVCDLPRVMRIPGFYHQKGEPFLIKLVNHNPFQPYEINEIVQGLGLNQIPEEVVKKDEGPLTPIEEIVESRIQKGERHLTLLRYASKYSHQLALPRPVIRWIIEGMNREACVEPVTENDIRRIVNQAEEYAERERVKDIGINIDAFLKKDKPYEPLPEKLLRPPGLVGDIVKYILDCSIKPQPELALAAALVACGTLMGRKVRTETDLRTNLYCLSLIDTGGGKEWPRRAIQRLFNAVNQLPQAATEEVTSDTALIEVAAASPSCLLLLDEFGRFMRSANRFDAPPHVAGITSVLLKLYSSASGPFAGKSFADPKRNKTIQQPNVSVLGTSVPDNFFRSITTESTVDGFLNRFLLFQSQDPDPVMRKVTDFTPPVALVREFAEWQSIPYRPSGDLAMVADLVPEPRIVANAPLATQIFEDFEHTLRNRRAVARKENFHGMFTRGADTAKRVALILSCGEDKRTTVIEGRHAEYACELVMNSVENLVRAVKGNVADTQHQARVQRVMSIIRANMPDGVGLTVLGDRAGFPRKELRSLLDELEESGKIQVAEVKTSSRPQRVYYATSAQLLGV